jgi:hypothetical protein
MILYNFIDKKIFLALQIIFDIITKMTLQLNLFMNEQDNQEWRDVKNHEDYTQHYQISNKGHLRSINKNGKIRYVHGSLKEDGYKITYFKRKDTGKFNKMRFHLLVANSWIEPDSSKPQVNHLDGNKLNNSVENLGRCTHQENIIHARKLGLFTNNPGTNPKNLPSRPKFNGKAFKNKSREEYIVAFLNHHKEVVQMIQQGTSQPKIKEALAQMGYHICLITIYQITKILKESKRLGIVLNWD